MNIDHKEQTIQAFRLRDAVSPYIDSANLTQAQSLDVLAQAHGLKDWQTWRAQLARTWAYRRHEAYLPNDVATVKALSVRKAVFNDLHDFAETEDSFSQVVQALQRMFRQLNAVRHEELKVDYELKSAIHASGSQTVDHLEQHVNGSARNVADFLSDFGNTPMSVTNAERYQNLYLTWRLATLSLALANLRDQPRTGSLLQLVGERADLYGFVGLNLNGNLTPNSRRPTGDALHSMTDALRREDSNLRYFAKAVTLEYLSGSTEHYAQLSNTLKLPQWPSTVSEGYAMLDKLFPEIALWQAWVELKSLLASDADAFYKERNR